MYYSTFDSYNIISPYITTAIRYILSVYVELAYSQDISFQLINHTRQLKTQIYNYNGCTIGIIEIYIFIRVIAGLFTIITMILDVFAGLYTLIFAYL